MMKPQKDPFYKRRKEAMEGLRSLVRSSIRIAAGSTQPVMVELFIGHPGATRTNSVAAGCTIYHVKIPRDWRYKVYMQDLAVLEGGLCLRAQKVGKRGVADGCWRVLVFDVRTGHIANPFAVKVGSVIRTGASATIAYERCLNVLRDALMGE